MYELTWTQAQEAMREGKRVKNRHFTSEEFFYMEDGKIFDEHGYPMAGWDKGYDWQHEGWMILESETKDELRVIGASTGKDRQKVKAVVLCDNYSALEGRVIALFTGGCYTADTMDYWVGISPRSPTLPREKENYNFRITKGRGHNKLKRRKKK
ncbi:hypothetical protein EPNKCIFM_00150 [Klebsiella phage KP13-16]|nr:hypothetical protein EPNKCIFM_00150 [Klebsiella phage KP13-16]